MHQPLLLGHEQFVASIFSIKDYPSHWHSEIEIVYCISGSFQVKINGHLFSAQSGHIVFIGSTEEHEFLHGEDAVILLIEIGFSFLGTEFVELARLQFESPLLDINSPKNISEEAAVKLNENIQTIIGATRDMSYSVETSWTIKGALFTLAALTLKYVPHVNIISEKRQKRMKAILNSQLAFDYIRNNYQKDISIDDVAKITGFEKSNFCKQFKNATQTSFHQYLNSYRIGLALRLLESDEYTVQAIGEKVGIPEAKSFSRIFRQFMNMSPTEYRNRKGNI